MSGVRWSHSFCLLYVLAVVCSAGTCCDGAEIAGEQPRRWAPEKAWDWYKERPWLVGFNYVPSTACNTTEWWQAETFDPETIDRELGWAADLGLNTARCFIQYIVWKDDSEGLKKRFDRFLEIADKHGISVMPVLFDDCAFGEPPQLDPYLGKQREPTPGMILPSWTPSPGQKLGLDRAERASFEAYVQDLIGTFREDRRIVVWDLYNEPMNIAKVGTPELVGELFVYARAARPLQPLTVGVWNDNQGGNEVVLACSDVVSYHCYSNDEGMRARIGHFKQYGRPLVCTEWMARPTGSRIETDLPLLKQEAVGCYMWGLVNGRTQAQFPWWNKANGPVAEAGWFHDIFRGDGTPYREGEIEAIREAAGEKRLGFTGD